MIDNALSFLVDGGGRGILRDEKEVRTKRGGREEKREREKERIREGGGGCVREKISREMTGKNEKKDKTKEGKKQRIIKKSQRRKEREGKKGKGKGKGKEQGKTSSSSCGSSFVSFPHRERFCRCAAWIVTRERDWRD